MATANRTLIEEVKPAMQPRNKQRRRFQSCAFSGVRRCKFGLVCNLCVAIGNALAGAITGTVNSSSSAFSPTRRRKTYLHYNCLAVFPMEISEIRHCVEHITLSNRTRRARNVDGILFVIRVFCVPPRARWKYHRSGRRVRHRLE